MLITIGVWLFRCYRVIAQEPFASVEELLPTVQLSMTDWKDGPAPADTVNCSVFAPRVAPRGKFQIQAYLHLLDDDSKVELQAAATDPTASRRAFETLTRPIARGAVVDLLLFCADLTIAQPRRQLRWEGRVERQLFEVEAPTDLASDSIEPVLHVYVNGIPVGCIGFKVHIEPDVPMSERLSRRMTASSTPADRYAETHVTDYKTAFVSYARADFVNVSYFAEGLKQNRINLLVDVTVLEPGQEWEKELPAHIARADVFFLMWSDAAAESKWVDKEARQAVQLYDGSDPHRPIIEPIASHRPLPKVPDYLKKFHFNSVWVDRRTAEQMPLFRPSR